MKRTTRYLSVVFAAAMLLTMFSQPGTAEAKNWKWKKYRLRVWLPDAMRPTQKNNVHFIAKGAGIVFKVKPWKSRRTTSKKAAFFGLRSYKIIKGKRILFQGRMGKAGAFVYTIVGQGFVGKRRAFFAVVGLSSKRSVNNFYARMWWRPKNHAWVKGRVKLIARRLQVY